MPDLIERRAVLEAVDAEIDRAITGFPQYSNRRIFLMTVHECIGRAITAIPAAAVEPRPDVEDDIADEIDQARERLMENFQECEDPSDRFSDLHAIVMLANAVRRVYGRLSDLAAAEDGR